MERQPSPRLGANEIDLWWASVASWRPWLADLYRMLSRDEQIRADRFKVVPPRQSFIVAHSLIRMLLSRYLGCTTRCLAFAQGDKGKPYLLAPANRRSISFNLSHSGDLVVAGLTREVEIGVDVERLRDMPRAVELAERFFTRGEHAGLLALPQTVRSEAFLRCWTYKEAYLKAVGKGISEALDGVEATIDPEEQPRLISIGGDHSHAQAWSLLSCEPCPGYVAAVVLPAGMWQLNLRRYRSPEITGS
jgi:4'-phosphopantetheinyl transferase